MSGFDELGIGLALFTKTKELGWEKPSTIQQKAIPVILAGRDLMAIAQTGSGKTGAFLLPILQRLSQNKSKQNQNPSVLILAPTRELAIQLHKNAEIFSEAVARSACLLVGGLSVLTQKEALTLKPEIVVATPGRLLDHLRRNHLNLSGIQYLVLDEADRMLDMGFLPDIKNILTRCSEPRQSLLFSATLSDEIHLLAQKLLKRPILIEVNANRDAGSIEQKVFRVPEREKPTFLRDLIVDNSLNQVLVFTRQKESAAKLASHLKEDGFKVEALHGDKTQARRTKILEAFKNHELRILVATDLASRGIDIKELPVVINYELPQDPHDYIHRIGRTGRAGEKGVAYSLVSEKDTYKLKAIETLIKRKLSLETPAIYKTYFEKEDRVEDAPMAKSLTRDSKPKHSVSKERTHKKDRKAFSGEKRSLKEKRNTGLDSFDYILPDF